MVWTVAWTVLWCLSEGGWCRIHPSCVSLAINFILRWQQRGVWRTTFDIHIGSIHMDIVFPNESREYRWYPGDQFRKGRAHFSFGMPAFQHHFIPVSEREECCERYIEDKHFCKSEDYKSYGRFFWNSYSQGIWAVFGLQEPSALQQVNCYIKGVDVRIGWCPSCHQFPEEHTKGPLVRQWKRESRWEVWLHKYERQSVGLDNETCFSVLNTRAVWGKNFLQGN